MAAVSICSDFGPPENKVCHCFHCFPTYLPWSCGRLGGADSEKRTWTASLGNWQNFTSTASCFMHGGKEKPYKNQGYTDGAWACTKLIAASLQS